MSLLLLKFIGHVVGGLGPVCPYASAVPAELFPKKEGLMSSSARTAKRVDAPASTASWVHEEIGLAPPSSPLILEIAVFTPARCVIEMIP